MIIQFVTRCGQLINESTITSHHIVNILKDSFWSLYLYHSMTQIIMCIGCHNNHQMGLVIVDWNPESQKNSYKLAYIQLPVYVPCPHFLSNWLYWRNNRQLGHVISSQNDNVMMWWPPPWISKNCCNLRTVEAISTKFNSKVVPITYSQPAVTNILVKNKSIGDGLS